MRAVRWHGRNDVRVEDVELRQPEANEVVVEVLWCGLCGTDLEEIRSGPLTIPVVPHPLSGRQAPLTLGHEIVGRVVRAAADGSGPGEGTVVVPDVVNGCGRCWWCLRHEEGLCPILSVPGQQDDGGLAELMIARASTCLIVPAGLPTRLAVLAEPAAVAVRALGKVPALGGGTLLVLGAGTIGQLVVQIACAQGFSSCVLVDPSPFRRQFAASRSPVRTCTPDELDELLAVLTSPGVSAVVECSGATGQLDRALRAVRPGGTVVAVGLRAGEERISVPDLVLAERTLVGSAAHIWDVDVARAVALLADSSIRVDGLITEEVTLESAPGRLLDLASSGMSSEDLKIVVRCSDWSDR